MRKREGAWSRRWPALPLPGRRVLSLLCFPPPSMTHSTGLRTPPEPAMPKVSSAVRGCMHRGSVSGLTGMAPHVAWAHGAAGWAHGAAASTHGAAS